MAAAPYLIVYSAESALAAKLPSAAALFAVFWPVTVPYTAYNATTHALALESIEATAVVVDTSRVVLPVCIAAFVSA